MVVISDGTKVAIVFRLDEVSHEVPMFNKLADPSIVSCVPADKCCDDGTQDSTPKSWGIQNLVVPFNIDYFLISMMG